MRFALLTLTDALRANGDCLFNGGVAGTMDLFFGECKAFSLVVLFVWIEAGGAFFRNVSGCMLALRLVGVGAGPSPALMPSSDNTDLLLFTVVVLPTAVDIFFLYEKVGKREREKKKTRLFISISLVSLQCCKKGAMWHLIG
jgi:hypothetical protein